MIHMLDECHISCSFEVELRFTFLYFLQPILRWLNGEVGCIVSKVEKEWLCCIFRLLSNVIYCPAAKHPGGMPFWFDGLIVQSHPINSSAQMGPVVIHHITEETMEEGESAIIGQVGCFITQVPFSDHTSVVTCLIHKLGKGWTGGIEIPPVTFRILADDSGCTHKVGITTGQ